MSFTTSAPAGADALLSALYGGELFHLGASAASRRLVDDARALLREALGDVDDDLRLAPARLPGDEFFRRMGALRRRLYLGEDFHEHLRALVVELGFDLDRVAFDPLRLRIIQGGGHHNPAARAVYYPHRDTWYGHPQSLVVGWIPLDDLREEETFVFFPEYLRRPAPNDSEIFDYDAWVRHGWSLKIGWQDPEAGLRARYPQMTGPIDPAAEVLGFACGAGDRILFAGAHLHQTRAQIGERTRYSLDFRLVDLADAAAGRGAPNVDSRARGSAVPDYVRGAPPHG
ncbi:MAG: hypothetical protein H6710_22245 [Myxococcales bacterium]|nr:hypothetical protein [Myxococcales bacterium]MCB9704059.1 hypothetical protein [Myxococcales bacterium]